jgi:acyl-CoA thioester hydrolase
MEQEKQKVFSKIFKVRQYECDSGGGVAHAIYLNYLEEARHDVLTELNFPFEELKKQKLGFVVLHVDIDYRVSLIAGDNFLVETVMKRVSKLRLRFDQKIYRLPEKTLIATGVNVGTTVDAENKPLMPKIIEVLLTDYPIQKSD